MTAWNNSVVYSVLYTMSIIGNTLLRKAVNVPKCLPAQRGFLHKKVRKLSGES